MDLAREQQWAEHLPCGRCSALTLTVVRSRRVHCTACGWECWVECAEATAAVNLLALQRGEQRYRMCPHAQA